MGDVLRLAAHDTSAAFEPDCSYRPESLVENALGSGADQILLLIDTCRADRDAVHAVRVALGDWAKRACPPGGAGWLGVLANCPADDPADDQDAVSSGILLEAAGRLLRAGPSSGTYRRAWSVQNAGITGRELLQTLRDELADDEQPLVHVESGTARVMFPNPRWRPAQVMFPNPRWRPVQRPHLVEHLVAASRGAAPQDEGWFFTGRRAVLGQIVAWMHTEAPGAFVVTGSAGCGKSAVLGRIVALSETAERAALLEHAPLEPADPDPRLGAIDAAVHLRGMGALDTFRVLAEAYPEDYLTDLVTSLKNLAGHLAALDRISDAVDIYTSSVETFVASPAARDALIIERAGFQISHGDAPTGLRELVTLLTSEGTETSDGTPEAITLAARNALRAHRTRDALAVHHAWQEVSGTEPPNWLALTAEQICIVVEWIVAPNWAGSKDFFAAHVEELLAPPATIALEEMRLLVSPRADQHQLLLEDIRERGIDAAYRPLLLRDRISPSPRR